MSDQIKILIASECVRCDSLMEYIEKNRDLSNLGLVNSKNKKITLERYSEIELAATLFFDDET